MMITCGRAMRPHHWVKNSLLAVPLIASTRIDNLLLIEKVSLGLVAFSLASSATYILNDLIDLPTDRIHPVKRQRPLASGELSVPQGLLLMLACLAGAVGPSLLLPAGFSLFVLIYLVTTVCYSLMAKTIPFVDVILLATLYTLRVLSGSAAIGAPAPAWLLASSMFFFLSLAFAKRGAELMSGDAAPGGRLIGRGYDSSHLPVIRAIGPVLALVAAELMAFGFPLHRGTLLYRNSSILCTLLLLWHLRFWFVLGAGRLREDLVVFALKDPACLVICGLMLSTLLVSSFW